MFKLGSLEWPIRGAYWTKGDDVPEVSILTRAGGDKKSFDFFLLERGRPRIRNRLVPGTMDPSMIIVGRLVRPVYGDFLSRCVRSRAAVA